jgi:AraC-like DNA-binding protein
MEEGLRQYLGESKFPFSPAEFRDITDMHLGPSMVVILPKATVNLPVGTHVHSSYEFMLPLAPMPVSLVGDSPVVFEPNKLFPINCDQPHGQVERSYNSRFIAFQIEKAFVQNISYEMYGSRQLLFRNSSHEWSVDLQSLLKSFVEESTNRQAGHTLIMESLSTQIVINIFRQIDHNMGEPLKDSFYSDRDNINRAIEFLNDYSGADYSLGDVAKVANLSTYHFIRVFKSETGKTPIDYLIDIKVKKAKYMLMNKNKSISEVCYECGFSNPSHFTRIFKTKVGVPPSVYRKSFLGI